MPCKKSPESLRKITSDFLVNFTKKISSDSEGDVSVKNLSSPQPITLPWSICQDIVNTNSGNLNMFQYHVFLNSDMNSIKISDMNTYETESGKEFYQEVELDHRKLFKLLENRCLNLRYFEYDNKAYIQEEVSKIISRWLKLFGHKLIHFEMKNIDKRIMEVLAKTCENLVTLKLNEQGKFKIDQLDVLNCLIKKSLKQLQNIHFGAAGLYSDPEYRLPEKVFGLPKLKCLHLPNFNAPKQMKNVPVDDKMEEIIISQADLLVFSQRFPNLKALSAININVVLGNLSNLTNLDYKGDFSNIAEFIVNKGEQLRRFKFRENNNQTLDLVLVLKNCENLRELDFEVSPNATTTTCENFTPDFSNIQKLTIEWIPYGHERSQFDKQKDAQLLTLIDTILITSCSLKELNLTSFYNKRILQTGIKHHGFRKLETLKVGTIYKRDGGNFRFYCVEDFYTIFKLIKSENNLRVVDLNGSGIEKQDYKTISGMIEYAKDAHLDIKIYCHRPFFFDRSQIRPGYFD